MQASAELRALHSAPVEAVRLDKWLWAARLYKARSIAKQAIEAGHVRYAGERCKVGRSVEIGALLRVRQGWDEREVRVLGLSDRRLGAPEAGLLYEETADSLNRRELARLARAAASAQSPEEKPSKKQRRMLERFKRDHGWS
jgi:ribosome-associated heat shock protein Hsp15